MTPVVPSPLLAAGECDLSRALDDAATRPRLLAHAFVRLQTRFGPRRHELAEQAVQETSREVGRDGIRSTRIKVSRSVGACLPFVFWTYWSPVLIQEVPYERIDERMAEDLCLRNISPATRRNYPALHQRVF